jgi:hypothetical protein
VVDGEHVGEFATKALDPDQRPTPRALNVAVGDETEKVFGQALAVDPSRRPRDAGELWGMLKHAMQVDLRSGRPPSLVASPLEDSPSTLRMKDRSSAGFALGGTLRMDRPSRSASELLAETPVPAAVTPAPPAPSVPPGDTPLPALPVLVPSYPAPAPRPSHLPEAGRAGSMPIPQQTSRVAMRLVAFVLLVVAVVAVAGIAWRAFQRPPAVPATSP